MEAYFITFFDIKGIVSFKSFYKTKQSYVEILERLHGTVPMERPEL
jgi:hypothetical protein